MQNYSKTYSQWYMREFWKTKTILFGVQVTIISLILIAAVAMTGYGNF